MRFVCQQCGETHDELPDMGADYPDQWFSIPEAERAVRCRRTPDTCVIDGDHFIRGVILLPLVDAEPGGRDSFGLGVWVSQSANNFQTYLDQPNTAAIGPFFGWLCTQIRSYDPSTAGLKTCAHFRGNNQRPTIELEPTDHPLAIHQRDGITTARAWDVIHAYMPSANN